ncbi:MAG: nitroreductase family protein [Kiritimatiellae bacterium]|nr:nitroreductase family protein [Kiritimatiellia bacterium]
MKTTFITTAITAVALAVGLAVGEPEAPLADIPLPAPRMAGGKPLLTALKERQTSRAFSAKPLPMQLVSDLLWAAFGINRTDTGKRTAPSARNWQEIDVYVVLAEGAYRYDAQANLLRAVVKGDLRALTGRQPFVATAPLNLVYVADPARMKGADAADISLYSGADAAFIGQNVYLFCASEGLGTVVRGLVDREALAEALKLPKPLRIVFAQTVGYPEEKAAPAPL